MSNDEIIEMARQAGLEVVIQQSSDGLSKTVRMPPMKPLEAFAKLVAAKEREDIARYCIWLNDEAGYTDGYDFANAIRVKGQT
jgi:hypothetical protein